MINIQLIFIAALILNFVWENVHAPLYSNYKGGRITQLILFRASLFDAFLIAIIVSPFIFFSSLKSLEWLIFLMGLVIAVINEWYGLSTKRWKYNSRVPTLPIINVGLTPAIQLSILGYTSFIFYENIPYFLSIF